MDGLAAVHSAKGTGVGFDLSFVTWNCASLFGFAPRDEAGRKRYRSKVDKVINLAMSHDVAFLQEVHWAKATCHLLGVTFLIIFCVVLFVLARLLVVFSLLFILGSGRGMVTVGV